MPDDLDGRGVGVHVNYGNTQEPFAAGCVRIREAEPECASFFRRHWFTADPSTSCAAEPRARSHNPRPHRANGAALQHRLSGLVSDFVLDDCPKSVAVFPFALDR